MKRIEYHTVLHQTIVFSNQITTTMSELALYIPCVYKNITPEMIAQTFYRKKIGSVRHVDLVPHNEKYNRAHVFFESMYPFGQGAEQMEKIANGETVKLQYSRNQHVFWFLMKNLHRKYDGVSTDGWYDPEQNNKEETKEKDNKEETQEKLTDSYLQAVHRNQKREHDDIVRQTDTMGHCTEMMSCDPTSTPWGYGMEPSTEPFKRSRSSVMPIHDKLEVVNLEMEEENDDDTFGLVSADYVQSIELELARVRMQRDEALHARPYMHHRTPCEQHLTELRAKNFDMRSRYDELCRVKLPFDDDMCRPVLHQVSDFGCSDEYYDTLGREIERFKRDNEILNENTNVLSCMPNSSANRPSNPVANKNIMNDNDLSAYQYRPPSPITTPPDMEKYHLDVCIPDCDYPMM